MTSRRPPHTHSYIFLYRYFVLRKTTKLLVSVLGEVQIPERPLQFSSLLTQLSVSLLQLLLPQQDGLHLLLTQSLLLPGDDSLF